MTAPVVSVIMAAYNGAALIGETLASLSRQTMADFEILVVDDCSTDATRDVIAACPDPRVRLIALDANGGPVRARNHAVAVARGRYLAALDQDDLCHPDRFARQVAYLDRHPGIALVGSAVRLLDDTGHLRPSRHAVTTTPALLDWLLAIENPLAWSSAMIRGDAARALDPFTRPDILYAEDFDLYQRLRRFGGVARIDRPLIDYRVHAGGASQRYEDVMRASAARVLAERHVDALGVDDAIAAGWLLCRHVMGGEAVPDLATYRRLGTLLSRLQGDHLAATRPGAADRRLIRWETARRWARIGRTGLRAGTLTPRQVMATRPPHLGLGYAGVEALLWSGAIGRIRRLARRLSPLVPPRSAKR